MDLLDVLEAMGTTFHEHHADILRWSWKLFCAKWVRLTIAIDREQRREEKRQDERQDAEDRMALYEVRQRLDAQGG